MDILKDKVIVVLGASSGIGESISRYFAQRGSKVYGYARREELLEQMAKEEENFFMVNVMP